MHNHFAADLGVDTVADAVAAVARGSAIRADVGRIQPLAGNGTTRTEPVFFLNTFSLGAHPDLVRIRERWSSKIGGPPATLLGVARILRTGRPLQATVNGHPRSMWLLFAGNGAYRSIGLAPNRRHDLADGLLDVRLAHAGRLARARLLTAALAGQLARTRVYAAARPRRLMVSGLPEGTQMAYDGEVAPAPSAILLDKLPEVLTVYRPASG